MEKNRDLEKDDRLKDSVCDLIREQALLRPDAIAIEDGGVFYTYRQLDHASDLIARRLLREKLNEEESVALLLGRSSLFVIAALGVMKAGGCYLPIDNEMPIKGKSFLLEDSHTRFALADANQSELCAGLVERVFPVDSQLSTFGDEGVAETFPVTDPSRKAYLIYTSGSTGLPKGVEIEHHSLTNLVRCFHREFGMGCEDRVTMVANVAFDACVADLWPALCAGATVIIPPRGVVVDPVGLIRWLATERATISFVPTALTELLFEYPWPEGMDFRLLMTGGDILRSRPPEGLSFAVINGYGPTENTVMSTFSVVSSVLTDSFPSIGRPIDHVAAYVLDENLRPLDAGEEGELYLGGEQVARGYWNRPELTEKFFMPDPFSSRPGARMYRTGDWVRKDRSGELDFIGRRDDQIQIYGRRFELGEIEHKLLLHPLVGQVCCRPLRVEGSVTGVAAHIVAAEWHQELQEELRQYLLLTLPPGVVPAIYIFHDRFPMTSHGKIDRAILDGMTFHSKDRPNCREKSEKELIDLWKSKVPAWKDGDMDASIFHFGADSLTAASLLHEAERITGSPLPLSTFLRNPSLSGFIDECRRAGSNTDSPIFAFHRNGTRPPIFFTYYLAGDIGGYFHLVERMGPDQPVYAIRSPALYDLKALPESIEAAARGVIEQIRSVVDADELALIGYSWGGLLAFEVARQLVEDGGQPPFVGMIGTPAPRIRVGAMGKIIHFAKYFPGWFLKLMFDSERREKFFSKLRGFFDKKPLVEHAPNLEGWDSNPIVIHHMKILGHYSPSVRKPFKIDLFREFEDYDMDAHPFEASNSKHLRDWGWGLWSHMPPSIHWLDIDHLGILSPAYVDRLAKVIRRAIDKHFALKS